MKAPVWIRALEQCPSEAASRVPTVTALASGDARIDYQGQHVVTIHAATFGVETVAVALAVAPALLQPKGIC